MMTPADVLWLFFLFSALQPVVKQHYLEASRLRLIAKIERKWKSRVILLVHRQETMSILGFPMFRYIDVNDSEELLRAIHLTDPAVPPGYRVAHARRTGAGRSADRACHS
jgi:ClpP class serine protease